MNKEWKFCDNCQRWQYILSVGDRAFCEVCNCAPGQRADATPYQPSYAQERDWRILRWSARWGNDLMDDTFKLAGAFEDQIAALTLACPTPSAEEVKL